MSIQKEILDKAEIINDSIIKIDNIVNHKVDVRILKKIALDLYEKIDNKEKITKILTVETGGIAIAILISLLLDNVEIVYAKKSSSKILSTNVYETLVKSYTKGIEYEMQVDKKYITQNDNVLIVDDFLASGEALNGLINIANQANATVSNIAVIINKSFQNNKINSELKVISCIEIKSIKNSIVEY